MSEHFFDDRRAAGINQQRQGKTGGLDENIIQLSFRIFGETGNGKEGNSFKTRQDAHPQKINHRDIDPNRNDNMANADFHLQNDKVLKFI